MNKIKDIIRNLSGVSAGTWQRLAILIISMLNMFLQGIGIRTIPIAGDEVNFLISVAFTLVCALTAYWKNNSFTEAAQAADRVLRGEAEILENDPPQGT